MDNEDSEVGSVDVRISQKAIYKAVRNIIANELQLDADALKRQARERAEEIIKAEVFSYIGSTGHGRAQLESRVNRALEHRIADLGPIVREAVDRIVRQQIGEEITGVVGAIIERGLEVNLGWNKKIKVKVREEA